MDEHRPFGAVLRRFRLAAGLTHETLAERAGLGARTISDLERGVSRAPRFDTLALLVDALGLSPEQRAVLEAAARPLTAPSTEPTPVAGRGSPPMPLTGFIGRDEEAHAVQGMLHRAGVRLVTLTGPGGVGKTRLALSVTQDVAEAFVDGTAFVPLAAITDPTLVAPAIAQALGVREAGDLPLAARIASVLRDKRFLLVLDNFEQVVEAAPAVADLLLASPGLTVLVTSRVRLRVSGEREYPVPPLALPESGAPLTVTRLAESAAVRLFAERAEAVAPGFALSDENAGAVAEICRRLDGLPLAIELAAARTKVLPPAALLDRLDRRLPLLTGGARDLPARQQTMRDAIAWSYDLLTTGERVLFQRLAVFVGGCTLDAAETVAGASGAIDPDVLDGIASLVDKSLLRQEAGSDGQPRYGMLETVREYGLERLAESGDEATMRDGHAAYVLGLTEAGAAAWLTPAEAPWFDRLEAEHANLRATLSWALEQQEADPARIALGLRLAAALHGFWRARCHFAEGRRWLEVALATADDAPVGLRAMLLWAAGSMVSFQRDHAAAVPLTEQALALAREAGDAVIAARILAFFGEVIFKAGETDRARATWEEAASCFEDLPEDPWTAFAPKNLGYLALLAGDHGRAEALLAESLAIARRVDHTWGTAEALALLAELARLRGDGRRAAEGFAEALTTYEGISDRIGIAQCLTGLGRVAAMRGHPADAVRLFGAAAAIHEQLGSRQLHGADARDEELLAPMRAVLGREAFDLAWTEGFVLPLARAIAEASALADPTAPAGLPRAARAPA